MSHETEPEPVSEMSDEQLDHEWKDWLAVAAREVYTDEAEPVLKWVFRYERAREVYEERFARRLK